MSLFQVACIIPTMDRSEILRATLTGLFESTKGISVQAVVLIDRDRDSYRTCVELGLQYPNIVISFSDTQRGAIPCWNYGTRIAQADKFFHMGDDLTFEDGWLDKVLESHQTRLNGYGLVGTNDGMHNGNVTVATHVLFDRQFCKDVLGGVMACPKYKYYCVDNEFNERAKKAGRFFWREDALTKHLHPANNGRPIDASDRARQPFWEHDVALLETRRAMGFPDDFEPVI